MIFECFGQLTESIFMVRCGRAKQIKRSDIRSGLKLAVNRYLPAGTVLIYIYLHLVCRRH